MDNDERLIILKMVQEGKITVEQALELLNALDGKETNTDDTSAFDTSEAIGEQNGKKDTEVFSQSTLQKPEEPKLMQEPEHAPETTQQIRLKMPKPPKPPFMMGMDKILGSFFADGFVNFGMPQFSFSKTFTIPVQEGINFTLRGKNGHIELIPSSEQDIRLEIKWRKRVNKPDGVDVFKKSDDEWDMNVIGDVQIVTVNAYVPMRYYGNIRLFTSNGHIKVCPIDCSYLEAVTSNASIDTLKACSESSLRLTTSNAHINVNNCESSLLWAHTCNAHVDVSGGRYEQVDLMTSNAHVKAEGVKIQNARINTSNGRIMVDDCEIDDIFTQTSNANIDIQDLWPNPDTEQAKVEAISSNGAINIRIKNKEDRVYDVNAVTSDGKAIVSLPGISISSGHQAVATGSGYDKASRRMSIQVRSSNGNVSIE